MVHRLNAIDVDGHWYDYNEIVKLLQKISDLENDVENLEYEAMGEDL